MCKVALSCFGDNMDNCIYLELDTALFFLVVEVWSHLVGPQKTE